jgi:hypothetical protein
VALALLPAMPQAARWIGDDGYQNQMLVHGGCHIEQQWKSAQRVNAHPGTRAVCDVLEEVSQCVAALVRASASTASLVPYCWSKRGSQAFGRSVNQPLALEPCGRRQLQHDVESMLQL